MSDILHMADVNITYHNSAYVYVCVCILWTIIIQLISLPTKVLFPLGIHGILFYFFSVSIACEVFASSGCILLRRHVLIKDKKENLLGFMLIMV